MELPEAPSWYVGDRSVGLIRISDASALSRTVVRRQTPGAVGLLGSLEKMPSSDSRGVEQKPSFTGSMLAPPSWTWVPRGPCS